MTGSDTSAGGAGLRGDVLTLGLIVAAGLALLFYFSSQRQTALRNSAVGFEGLQVWLTAEGQSARSFTGGWTIDPDPIGLLVQPIYDPRPTQVREPPTSKEELLMQEEEFDQRMSTVLEKSRKVTSLVILPKWRSGMRLTGLAHPVLLDDETGPRDIVRRLLADNTAGLSRIRQPFVDFAYTAGDATLTARLYVPQVVASTKCAPLVGTREAMVLGWCSGAQSGFFLLSDPDLFSNHGLRLADNAEIAADFLAASAEGRDLMIDYSSGDWLFEAGAPDSYDRGWDEFRRFFAYPFLTLWLAGGFTLALVLWRAARRYGPLLGSAEGPGSAKALAIQAGARLMRLTDQDGALVADYARARRASLAAALFGPTHGMDERALDRQLARSFPDRYPDLAAAMAAIRALPAKTTAADAITHVNALEQILETLEHEPR